MNDRGVDGVEEAPSTPTSATPDLNKGVSWGDTVSYTHLTLPTNREV